jgi:tRNA dimethylallyltransferase
MKVLFVVGPTASGKSQFSEELVQSRGGEILNADSVQVYRGLNIGSAKPGQEVRSRIRHHLVDHVEVGASYTAGDFRRESLECLRSRSEGGLKHLLVVGGTGFYLRALQFGMYEVPEIPSEIRANLRRRMEVEGLETLFEELMAVDPQACRKIDRHDAYRILRALEVFLTCGNTWTSIVEDFALKLDPFPYSYKKIGLTMDRELLRHRVVSRVDRMIAAGWIAEVQSLLDQVGAHWAPLKSVGYSEIVDYLDGKISEEDLVPRITKSTMLLAKRQMTWFRRDSEIEWFDVNESWAKAHSAAVSFLDSQKI